jgi:hypothetical protein
MYATLKSTPLQVIGGAKTYTAQWDSRKPSTSRLPPRVIITGPPRLPTELTTYIVILAAQLYTEDADSDSSALLQLARVDRAAHHAVLTRFILPELRLCGVHQIVSFSRDLQSNVLNLQNQVQRVKKLTVWRARERATLEFMRATSLFSGAEEVAHFEKATLEPLKVILSYCNNIEHLSLDMPARVLDTRTSKSEGQKHLGQSLKELVTLLSVYGGDLNESLWSPGNSYAPKWNNLTHLQLHGPRFRMTSLTALAISQLPSLTHLALIMPLLVQPHLPLNGSSAVVDAQVDSSRDALGRCNVLQILIDALGHRMQTLLLVCHDIESYVGNVQRLGPWMRTLQWKCNTKKSTLNGFQGTKLVLVTARPLNPLQTTPHPSLYSKWMLQRADRGDHWNWKGGVEAIDVCEEMKLAYSVERWTIPIVYQEPPRREESVDEHQSENRLAETEEAQIEEQSDSAWSGSDRELHGIDNLD